MVIARGGGRVGIPMQGKIQVRFAILAALAALVAVIVPSGLASGSHTLETDPPPVAGAPSIVYLTLGKQDKVTWTSEVQSISTKKNDCTAVSFGSSPQLLSVSAGGGVLGEVKDGLGVLSPSDGSGEPCGRVDADNAESISVKLGSALDDYLMTAIDVDLELKFNASVDVIFKHNGTMVDSITGFTGGESSDDGPDSKDGDNYRLLYQPDPAKYFDEVQFVPTAGSLSLEGGADGTDAGALDASNNSSQFEIVRAFDGELDCYPEDQATIGDIAVDTAYGTVRMRSQDSGSGWSIDECTLKPYDADTLAAALSYVPDLSGIEARYTIDATVEEQQITVDTDPSNSIPDGTITSLVAVYNETGDLTFPAASTDPLRACNFTPPTDSSGGSYNAFWQQMSPVDDGVLAAGGGDNTGTNLLPTGEIACFYSASVTPTGLDGSGNQIGTENWSIYFEDDPGWGFR